MTVFAWILVALIVIVVGALTLAPFILSGRISEQEDRAAADAAEEAVLEEELDDEDSEGQQMIDRELAGY